MDRVGAVMAAGQGSELTPEQTLDLFPIKWMYEDDNLSGEGGATTGDDEAPQDEEPSGYLARVGAAAGAAAAAAGRVARAAAHRNPLRHRNVYDLPRADERKRIYLVFTHTTGRHLVGVYVTKTVAIQIVNWFINLMKESGVEGLPELLPQGGGGKRRKRKSHKRKSHKRKTHKHKRTRRRR
jgi:hypothetical protein